MIRPSPRKAYSTVSPISWREDVRPVYSFCDTSGCKARFTARGSWLTVQSGSFDPPGRCRRTHPIRHTRLGKGHFELFLASALALADETLNIRREYAPSADCRDSAVPGERLHRCAPGASRRRRLVQQ